ncbi:MAG: hypothetical protein KDA96_21350, partial [Planctomycetaceae bacterium]|nr:hypothetical protein [Planctomycetaceae bacterium]
MSKSPFIVTLAVVAGLAFGSAQARAQVGNNIQRPLNNPTFSPYLNLFRGNNGGGPILNYFGLVRPQMQAMDQAQQFGQNIQQLQRMGQMGQGQGQGLMIPGRGGMGTTGHPVVFQSINTGALGAGGIGGGGRGIGGFAGGGFQGGAFQGG